MVRIGHTTIDSVTRAMQSLCNNNVLGIVVNGARRGELYSKYTYYHSYYTPKEPEQRAELAAAKQEADREIAAEQDQPSEWLVRIHNNARPGRHSTALRTGGIDSRDNPITWPKSIRASNEKARGSEPESSRNASIESVK